MSVQAQIKSKAVSAGAKAGKAGDKGAKGAGKSKTKGKVTKKKGKGKGKRSKALQSDPTGPEEVDICNFDSAAPSGKYHLRLSIPAAALVGHILMHLQATSAFQSFQNFQNSSLKPSVCVALDLHVKHAAS